MTRSITGSLEDDGIAGFGGNDLLRGFFGSDAIREARVMTLSSAVPVQISLRVTTGASVLMASTRSRIGTASLLSALTLQTGLLPVATQKVTISIFSMRLKVRRMATRYGAMIA